MLTIEEFLRLSNRLREYITANKSKIDFQNTRFPQMKFRF